MIASLPRQVTAEQLLAEALAYEGLPAPLSVVVDKTTHTVTLTLPSDTTRVLVTRMADAAYSVLPITVRVVVELAAGGATQ